MQRRSCLEAETRCRQAEELLQAERRGIDEIISGKADCELRIVEVGLGWSSPPSVEGSYFLLTLTHSLIFG